MRSKLILGLASGLIVFSLLLISCGKAEPTTTPTTTPATTPTTTPTTTAKPTTAPTTTAKPTTTPTTTATSVAPSSPQYGGTIIYAHNGEAGTLDPAAAVSGSDSWIYYGIYDSLVTEQPDGILWPYASLAESWEYTDLSTIVFHLRKDIKFQDGTDFNAEAVKYNYERMKNPNFRGGFAVPFAKLIKEIVIADKNTLTFKLTSPNVTFLTAQIGASGLMSSPTAIQKYGDKDYTFHPCGTGPFSLLDVVPSASATLTKNNGYWKKDAKGNSLPYLDKVNIIVMLEEATRSAALETGKVSFSTIPLADVDRFKASKNVDVVEHMNCAGYGLLMFNLKKAPMDNVDLRRAMCYAVDPKAIVEGALFGKGVVADAGMWTPDTWVYDKTVPRPYYDVAKAKEFLKAGGMPNGFKVDVMVASSFPENMRAADIMASQWKKVGIEATIKSYDVTTAGVKYFEQGETGVYLTVWARRIEPSTISGYLYKSDGYFNAGKVPNPTLDSLIAQGTATADQAQRKAIYRKINEIVLGDAIVVPMTYSLAYIGSWKYVQGMDMYFDSGLKPRYEYLWLKK